MTNEVRIYGTVSGSTELARMLGKIVNVYGPSGDFLAFGRLIGTRWDIPRPGESQRGGPVPMPFLLFDGGFRVPIQFYFSGEYRLVEVPLPDDYEETPK